MSKVASRREILSVPDRYGKELTPGCMVAFNFGGEVRKGRIKSIIGRTYEGYDGAHIRHEFQVRHVGANLMYVDEDPKHFSKVKRACNLIRIER